MSPIAVCGALVVMCAPMSSLSSPSGSKRKPLSALWGRFTRRLPGLERRIRDRLALFTPGPSQRSGLLVVLPHALGDYVLFAPAYRHLRALFADGEVTVVCMPSAEAFVAGVLAPDRIIAIDRTRMFHDQRYRSDMLQRIRDVGARVAVQPGANRQFLVEDALIRHSRADIRIGSSGTDSMISEEERRRGDRWYTRLIPEHSAVLHECYRAASFASRVIGRNIPPELLRLDAPARHPSAPNGPYLVICGETSSPLKTWPFERFMHVARALAKEHGLEMVVLGETQDAPQPGTIDLRGTTDYNAMLAILGNARIVLCNESAPAPLAAALRVPVVVVHGGGFPGRYVPIPDALLPHTAQAVVSADMDFPCVGCGWGCQFAPTRNVPAPCIEAVDVDRVLTAAREVLARSMQTVA